MNTADRNIRSIDIALRRRFDMFDCPPDADVLERYYSGADNRSDVPNLIEGFVALSDELTKQLDGHHTVGHAFFMASHFTQDDLDAVWRRKLQPLLGEYFLQVRIWLPALSCRSSGQVQVSDPNDDRDSTP